MNVSREELADLTGIGAYDEQRGRVALVRFHIWPAYGKEAHQTWISCWCKPYLADFYSSEGYEVWIHK